LPGFQDCLNLFLGQTDLSAQAIEFDHRAFFAVTLHGDLPAVFQNNYMLRLGQVDPTANSEERSDEHNAYHENEL
jgi:hypothetical protein